jgi:hypothetical protein
MRAEKRAPRRRPLTTGWNAFGFQGARNRGSRQAMAQRSSALPEYGCSRNSDSPSPSAGPDAESQRALAVRRVEPLPEHRQPPSLRIVQLQPASRQLCF